MHRSEESDAPSDRSPLYSLAYREAYTIPEIAELLGGSSERWIWMLIHQNVIPSIKVGGKRLVPRQDLIGWIEGLREDELKARNSAATA